jgi:hypothetical protein
VHTVKHLLDDPATKDDIATIRTQLEGVKRDVATLQLAYEELAKIVTAGFTDLKVGTAQMRAEMQVFRSPRT